MSDKEPLPPVELDIKAHVQLAEKHLQDAMKLAYGSQPQPYRVRTALGRAQSILISLVTNNKIR